MIEHSPVDDDHSYRPTGGCDPRPLRPRRAVAQISKDNLSRDIYIFVVLLPTGPDVHQLRLKPLRRSGFNVRIPATTHLPPRWIKHLQLRCPRVAGIDFEPRKLCLQSVLCHYGSDVFSRSFGFRRSGQPLSQAGEVLHMLKRLLRRQFIQHFLHPSVH